MKRDGTDGYNKLAIRFIYDSDSDSYTVFDAQHDSKFMQDINGVFSDYDVDIHISREWFKGVKLIETTTGPVPDPTPVDPTPVPSSSLENRVFKIMLLNNNQYFFKESGQEFRAGEDEKSGQEYKFIAAESADTYYLQSVESPDEYVSFAPGGWYLRLKRDGDGSYNKLPLKFTYDSDTDSYTVIDSLHGSKLIEESGKVFSNFDVGIGFRNWFKGVKLTETSTAPVDPTVDPTPVAPSSSLADRVFKI